jgi:hypothetical protein
MAWRDLFLKRRNLSNTEVIMDDLFQNKCRRFDDIVANFEGVEESKDRVICERGFDEEIQSEFERLSDSITHIQGRINKEQTIAHIDLNALEEQVENFVERLSDDTDELSGDPQPEWYQPDEYKYI